MSKAFAWLYGSCLGAAALPPRTAGPSSAFSGARRLCHPSSPNLLLCPLLAPSRGAHGFFHFLPSYRPSPHGGPASKRLDRRLPPPQVASGGAGGLARPTWRPEHRAYGDVSRNTPQTRDERSSAPSSAEVGNVSQSRSPRTPNNADSGHSHGHDESIASSVSKYLNLPKMPHRPSKEELLAAANGFWERVKVRFKWMSIRSMRPWNADEWGAFVSWFMLGHLVWILVGTTTFFSIIIFSINTVFAQGEHWSPLPRDMFAY